MRIHMQISINKQIVAKRIQEGIENVLHREAHAFNFLRLRNLFLHEPIENHTLQPLIYSMTRTRSLVNSSKTLGT